MNVARRHRLFRAHLIGGMLCVVALLAQTAQPASAGVVTCRADPIVVLMDGTVVRMSVTIAMHPRLVQEIVYTLYVPRGSVVREIVYTGGPLADKERVVLIDSLDKHRYVTDTLVRGRSGRATIAYTGVNGTRAFAKGLTNQRLRIRLHLIKT
jgi:hypothetical protein